MKVVGFEEHHGLPAIFEAAMKANDPYALVTSRHSGGRSPSACQPRCSPRRWVFE
jgi:hypothetical protein